jgi:hypothetical protein
VSITRGIECADFGTLAIERVAFGSPESEVRPWLSLDNCTTVVSDSDLLDSSAKGIDAIDGGDLTVRRCRVNQSDGDGISAQTSHLTVELTEISQNKGIGISAFSQFVAVRQSKIFSNPQGGVRSVGGVFDVTNNLVFRNGDQITATFGGMRLDSSLPGNRVEHNTVAWNERAYSTTPPVYAGGLFCNGGGSGANNLIVNNAHGNATEPAAQIGGTCDLTGSLVSSDSTPYNFVRPVAEPFDYHLADADSPAANAGIATAAPLQVDIDGQPRSDGMPDVGADEL